MKIDLLINTGKEILNFKNTVESINLSSSLHDTPSKCEFNLIGVYNFPNGSPVALKIDNNKVFYGFVFSKTIDSKEKTQVMAYDQLRYLKNQETLYLEDKTASQIFEEICKINELKFKTIDSSSWKVLPYLYEKKTMFEIIKHGIDETFRMENKKYIIRDNFGTLEFLNIENQKTNLQIGTGSLLTDYAYGQSIDEDTFNVVKLIRDNPETQKRDVWMVKDSANIAKWGKLQFLQDVDEQANEEQIKELANNILKVKNRETRSLDISILGFYNLKVGNGIKIKIDGILEEWFFLNEINANIKNNFATMDLGVSIV